MKSFFCKKTFCDGCRWHLDMGKKKMQSKDIPQNYSTFSNCIFCKIQNKITSTICWLFGASWEHICVGVSGKSCNEQMLQLLMMIFHWSFSDNLIPNSNQLRKVLNKQLCPHYGCCWSNAVHDSNSYSDCTILSFSSKKSKKSSKCISPICELHL